MPEGELVAELRSSTFWIGVKNGIECFDPKTHFFGEQIIYLTLFNAAPLSRYTLDVAAEEISLDAPSIRGVGEHGQLNLGGAAAEVVTLAGTDIPTITEPSPRLRDLLLSLHRPTGARELALEITGEFELYQAALDTVERRVESAETRIYRLINGPTPQVPGASAFPQGARLQPSLHQLIDVANGVRTALPSTITPSVLREQLDSVARVSSLLAAVQDSIAATQPLQAVASTRAIAFQLNVALQTLDRKLGRVGGAYELYSALGSGALDLLDETDALSERASLSASHENIDDANLARLIARYGTFRDQSNAAGGEARVGRAILCAELNLRTNASRPCPSGGSAVGRPVAARNSASDLLMLNGQALAELIQVTDSLERAVLNANQAVESLFDETNELYRASSDTRRVALGHWRSNQIVKLTVRETARFEPFRLTDTSNGGLDGDGSSGVATVSDSASTGRALASTSFEVHKHHRFTAMAGFAVSFIEDRRWPLVPPSDSASGPTVGTAIESPTQEFWLGLKMYPWARDAFPGSAPAASIGTFIGLGLTHPAEDLFAGLSLELVTGVDVALGVHWGKRSQLRQDIVEGGTLPQGATEVPVETERVARPFVGVTFDANFFRGVFSKAVDSGDIVPGT